MALGIPFNYRTANVTVPILAVAIPILSATAFLDTFTFAAGQETNSSTPADSPNAHDDSPPVLDSSPFLIRNESDPPPETWERILTDEILALEENMLTLRNASEYGDLQVIHDTTIEVAEGPNWGNISSELQYRGDLNTLNEFSLSLQELNTLSNASLADGQEEVGDTITRGIDDLEVKYENVLNALAVPIFDPMEFVSNLILPGVIVGLTIIFIPKIRKRLRIRY
jgi:hypothetical protein